MITNLKIQNFTLIDSLDIDFQRGFSVITGETGAGKSIILGALSMLLGQRADSKSVKAGAQRCVVEAHFDLSAYDMQAFFEAEELDYDAEDCILRRELTAAGKSRAFINDTPVPLATMRALGEQLVDIHSQHQNLLLRDADFQLSVVDIIAHDEALLSGYKKVYDDYVNAQRQLEETRNSIAANREREDYIRFIFDELTAANLQPGEQDELEQRQETMTHTEDIKSALYKADEVFNADDRGVITQLKQASNALSQIVGVFPAAEESSERIENCYIELKDLASELSSMMDRVEFDPDELQQINDRLDKLYSLETKYHKSSVEQLIELREEYRQQLANIEDGDDNVAKLEAVLDNQRKALTKIAAQLTSLRKRAAREVEKSMLERLVPLGIPNVQFKVEITAHDGFTAKGTDKVSLLFSANKGMALQPVAQVASGGEIARVMLALKAMISTAVSLPTIIFDEIDTGVSGKIAEAMAVIMNEMGQSGRQVISITHLPQIASRGAAHYKVEKTDTPTGTKSQMRQLSDPERIDEIAQMLSGSSISDAARMQAKELLCLSPLPLS